MTQFVPALSVDDLQAYMTTHHIQATLHRDVGSTPTVPAAAAALGVHPDQIVKTLLFAVEPAAVSFSPSTRDDSPQTRAGRMHPEEAPSHAELSPYTVVVISHGERRIDKRALAAHLGVGRKRVRLAEPEIVLEQLGFPAGGVPPFGHRHTRPVLLDGSVLHLAEQAGDPAAVRIFAGGGDAQTMLELTLAELLRVTSPALLPLSSA